MTTMKYCNLLLLLCLFNPISSFSQNNKDGIDTSKANIDTVILYHAKRTVNSFTTDMFNKGKIDSMLSKCAYPFVVDGQIISKVDELRQLFNQAKDAIDKRGNTIAINSIDFFGRRKELFNELIAIDVYILVCTIKINVKNEFATQQIIYAVQAGEHPKIIGIAL